MTKIPEHLLKRAQEARERAADSKNSTTAASSENVAFSKIPKHLLERAKEARERSAGLKDDTESKIPKHLLDRSKSVGAKSQGGLLKATVEPPRIMPNSDEVVIPLTGSELPNLENLLPAEPTIKIQDNVSAEQVEEAIARAEERGNMSLREARKIIDSGAVGPPLEAPSSAPQMASMASAKKRTPKTEPTLKLQEFYIVRRNQMYVVTNLLEPEDKFLQSFTAVENSFNPPLPTREKETNEDS